MNLEQDLQSISRPPVKSVHTFHIPVMGTGFTIDTPLRLAKYGISSVVSLVDDLLIEQMRKYHSEKNGIPYAEISDQEEDKRAKRITTYLDMMDDLVKKQVKQLQSEEFIPGSDITRYFEMLPETPLKRVYHEMLLTKDPEQKTLLQEKLRPLAVPGSIDVNIMSKGDRDLYVRGVKLPPEHSDAMAALRGYANSKLCSSIILSAGFNPRLYSYIAQFKDFFPDEHGLLKKKVVLKVSDYRSAVIQGKYLARRGIWVSEYRIESGLNCGGHAFATNGFLLGPILEELKQNKHELIETLYAMYIKSMPNQYRTFVTVPFDVRITVQGGIGTANENCFLIKYYLLDGTGWGTPFLLVPEATNVDEDHLRKLAEVKEEDDNVYLSDSSPFGLPFWNLRDSGSEEAREKRIETGKPGSICTRGHVKFNTEFTKVPICAASNTYQRLKLASLPKQGLTPEQEQIVKKDILAKSCICVDLGGAVSIKDGIDPTATPAICCGPNIVNFSKISTLDEMVGHIYGRISLLANSDRVHMFIKELMLYVEYFGKELNQFSQNLSTKTPKYFTEFRDNLMNGIEYYKRLSEHIVEEKKDKFINDLSVMKEKIDHLLQLTHLENYLEGGNA
ncbi:MAG: hypothetical protein Q8Q33_00930 [Chlamydiota bacterium]|nr:hypothetical protein [Chlamydiota bacterium]